MLLSLYIHGWENHSIDTFVNHYADYVGNDRIGKEYLANIKKKLETIANPNRYRKFLCMSPSQSDSPSDLDEELLPLSQRIRFDLDECMGPDPPAKQTQFGPSCLPFMTNPRTPLFQKHTALRSWKIWNRVLFVAPPLNQRPMTGFSCPFTNVDHPDRQEETAGLSTAQMPSPNQGEKGNNQEVMSSQQQTQNKQNDKNVTLDQAELAESTAAYKSSQQPQDEPRSLAFPWVPGGKGPIVPRSFQSPGTLTLNNFAYPSSSETSPRYVEYRSTKARPWSRQQRHFDTVGKWRDRIRRLLERSDSRYVLFCLSRVCVVILRNRVMFMHLFIHSLSLSHTNTCFVVCTNA